MQDNKSRDNRIKTIKSSEDLEQIILHLEKIKYEVGHTNRDIGEDLEYSILTRLRYLHSYLVETNQ